MMAHPKSLKTWVEIDKNAVRHNIQVLRKQRLGHRTKLYAVVKSNAYGHGISVFPKLADAYGVDGFCVDSVEEGIALRVQDIRKQILVLGYTHPALFSGAKEHDLTITLSTPEGLAALAQMRQRPDFHVKIDSGMHRHGFYPKGVSRAARFIKEHALPLTGVYTHFASAKDINYPTYTERQFSAFKGAVAALQKAGFRNLTKHAAATGGTLLNKKYHLDMVRIGIGLYGLWPSRELELGFGDTLTLKPVLSWRAVVAETKKVKKGDFIGYDLTYRAPRDTTLALLPVGYWHGVPRALSGVGSVLVNGREVFMAGRVAMDIIAVDTGSNRCKALDVVTLIGKDGNKELLASSVAEKIGTIHYELCTRINPLIERIAV